MGTTSQSKHFCKYEIRFGIRNWGRYLEANHHIYNDQQQGKAAVEPKLFVFPQNKLKPVLTLGFYDYLILLNTSHPQNKRGSSQNFPKLCYKKKNKKL